MKRLTKRGVINISMSHNWKLNRVIDEQLYYHHFQPIFNIHKDEVIGYESLLRSKYVDNPQTLFDQALELNKLLDLDIASCEKAINLFTKLLEQKEFNNNIFLNVFPSTLKSIQFMENILNVIDSLNFQPNQIVIELAESEQIENYAKLKETIQQLKEIGIQFALDDLDQGNASLKNILELEPNYVKLDRYFAKNLNKVKRKQELLKSLVDYCAINNIKVVLEGIETSQELSVAKSLGIDYGQGFLLGKPKSSLF